MNRPLLNTCHNVDGGTGGWSTVSATVDSRWSPTLNGGQARALTSLVTPADCRVDHRLQVVRRTVLREFGGSQRVTRGNGCVSTGLLLKSYVVGSDQ
ncbi:hypothetical protein Tco_0605931 [Tanacetum coccineum]